MVHAKHPKSNKKVVDIRACMYMYMAFEACVAQPYMYVCTCTRFLKLALRDRLCLYAVPVQGGGGWPKGRRFILMQSTHRNSRCHRLFFFKFLVFLLTRWWGKQLANNLYSGGRSSCSCSQHSLLQFSSQFSFSSQWRVPPVETPAKLV